MPSAEHQHDVVQLCPVLHMTMILFPLTGSCSSTCLSLRCDGVFAGTPDSRHSELPVRLVRQLDPEQWHSCSGNQHHRAPSAVLCQSAEPDGAHLLQLQLARIHACLGNLSTDCAMGHSLPVMDRHFDWSLCVHRQLPWAMCIHATRRHLADVGCVCSTTTLCQGFDMHVRPYSARVVHIAQLHDEDAVHLAFTLYGTVCRGPYRSILH